MKIVVVVVIGSSRGCLVRVLVENIGCTKLFFMLMNKKKTRKNMKSMTVKKEDKKTKTQHARQKNVKIKTVGQGKSFHVKN